VSQFSPAAVVYWIFLLFIIATASILGVLVPREEAVAQNDCGCNPKNSAVLDTYDNRYVYYMSLEEKGLPSFADFVISGIFTSTKVTEYREELSYALLE
jgi:hypothetical protein